METADIFAKGGPVVWVLIAYSIIALAIISERLLNFFLMRSPPRNIEHDLGLALQQHSLASLLDSMKGPEASVMQGIYHASRDRIKDLDSVSSRFGSEQLQRMERGFRSLSILGHTAPLLGLLGTIIGMIKAFMVIELAGGKVDSQALAGGIWEAMLTTGVGLAVAIPILLCLHILEGMADRRAHSMRHCAMLLLERLPHYHSDTDTEMDATYHREGIVHAV